MVLMQLRVNTASLQEDRSAKVREEKSQSERVPANEAHKPCLLSSRV